VTASPSQTTLRPPPWRNVRVIRVVFQILFLVAVVVLVLWLYGNLTTNLSRSGIRTDFGYMTRAAGFRISGAPEFSAREPVWRAVLVGFVNTIGVSFVGIALATILGIVIGVARLSTNWLVRKSTAAYVEAFRNVPILVLILFFFFAVIQTLPHVRDAIEIPGFVLSNRGVYVPWIETRERATAFLASLAVAGLLAAVVARWRTRRFDATGQPHHRALWSIGVFFATGFVGWLALGRPVVPSIPVLEERIVTGGYEFTPAYWALLVALVTYTSAFIAEIVRGSILAVPRGQSEAANALGLSGFHRLRYVILPQALRVAVPPTGNEFLNLAKNSSLGIAIGFPELTRVTFISISQGSPAPQSIVVLMGLYLCISLFLAAVTNLLNWRLQRRGGA
jgi:general L-amino acid transport system permease protein